MGWSVSCTVLQKCTIAATNVVVWELSGKTSCEGGSRLALSPSFCKSQHYVFLDQQVWNDLRLRLQDELLITERCVARPLSLFYHVQNFGLVSQAATGEAPWLEPAADWAGVSVSNLFCCFSGLTVLRCLWSWGGTVIVGCKASLCELSLKQPPQT